MPDPDSPNPWEYRARAVKAYKIARVLRTVPMDADAWRAAAPHTRERVAELAQVKYPSDLTWEAAIDVLAAMTDE